MNKQPHRTSKTRQALVDSFWKLYREKDIEKITIKEITTDAGFYRSTFYAYFTHVYGLLHEIEEGLIHEFLETTEKLMEEERFDQALEHILKFYEKNGEYVAVLLGPKGDREFYLKVKDIIISIFLARTGGEKEGLERDIAFEIMSSSVIALLNYWYEHRDAIRLRDVLLTGSGFFRKGMLPYLETQGIRFLD